MMVCGVDLSTKALTAAIIPLNRADTQTATFRTIKLSPHADRSQLYRNVRQTVAQLLIDAEGHHVSWVVVEAPRGPYAVRQLNGVYGAVCASIPAHIAYTSLEPQEWRVALSLSTRITKAEAILEGYAWLANHTGHAKPLTEHEADALHVARAGRRILENHYQEAAS